MLLKPTAEQSQVLQSSRPVLMLQSIAGSAKTTTLAAKAISLIEGKTNPSESPRFPLGTFYPHNMCKEKRSLSKIQFTEEFRQEAIRQIYDRAHPVAEVFAYSNGSARAPLSFLRAHTHL